MWRCHCEASGTLESTAPDGVKHPVALNRAGSKINDRSEPFKRHTSPAEMLCVALSMPETVRLLPKILDAGHIQFLYLLAPPALRSTTSNLLQNFLSNKARYFLVHNVHPSHQRFQ